MKCFDSRFSGTIHADMPGPLAGFTTLERNTRTGFNQSPGTVSPAAVPLPQTISVTIKPVDGPPESHRVNVPSIDGYDGYVDALYVVMLPTGKPAAKVVLDPDPYGVYVRRDGIESVFNYTLLPDTEDPKYQDFRELCKAAYLNDRQRVEKLLEQGASITWPDPRIGSALRQAAMHGDDALCEMMVDTATGAKVSSGDTFDASVFLRLGKISPARKLLNHIGPSNLTDADKLMLAKSSLSCSDSAAMRFLIEEAEFDIDMSMNPVGAPKQGLVYAAATKRNEDVLRYLLAETSADPNRSLPEHSPLDYAEQSLNRGQLDAKPIVRLLKQFGARNTPARSNR